MPEKNDAALTGQSTPAAKLLAGLTVLEMATSMKAAYCGRLFADQAASVIKVELPDHDSHPSSRLWLDHGKANVILDWRTGEGRDLLGQLCGVANVVLCDIDSAAEPWLPGFFQGQRNLRPGLVVTTLSDLGDTGPFAGRPATDLIVAAMSGICTINGRKDSTPLREPSNQTALVSALAAFIGTLAARANVARGGIGQEVSVSALEAMVSVLSPTMLQCSYQADSPKRRDSADGFLFECADGQVSIIISSRRSWQTILDLWEIHLDPGDTRFETEGDRRRNVAQVRELLRPALAHRLRRQVFEELCLVRVPCGMLLSPAEPPMDPHLVGRGSMLEIQEHHPGSGAWLPGPSFRLAGHFPAPVGRLHAYGEDTAIALSRAPLAGEQS